MYISTRGGSAPISASAAIYKGLAEDGGLFVPEKVMAFPEELWEKLPQMSYRELAREIFRLYLDDFSEDEIDRVVTNAYGDNFDDEDIAPIHTVSGNRHILELWHGPTAAFKDMALQALPHLLSISMEKQAGGKEVVILVATSGDTGKAALEGFADVPKTKIIVFYPNGGVSAIQRLQMATQTGDNTYVVALNGNFDDCQRGVKEIFGDAEFNAELDERGYRLSSANSINWGRLLPQIVYYFKAYAALLRDGKIAVGESIDVVVPTGNFGNILAAYYAKEMGLPIHRFLCASNENKVLTDAIADGHYDKRREFFRTSSPSMDILVSSNFERFVFELCGRDAEAVKALFAALDGEGHYQMPVAAVEKMQAVMVGEYATEAETLEAIGEMKKSDDYILDPHTAVAVKALAKFDAKHGRGGKAAVIDSTANPYKFNKAVYDGIHGAGAADDMDEFAVSQALTEETGMPIHRGLLDLDKKEIRHDKVVEKDGMKAIVAEILK
ncbi:MAG: threonine synthase [Firmicutes bacterium]|nr:threonine synthase [Bacillota bacterium]